MFRIELLIFFVVVLVKNSVLHPTGSPLSRCNNLEPSHAGAVTQTSPFPYQIIPGLDTVGNGQKLTVEIRALEPSRIFRGFLLQARTTNDSATIVGQFELTTGVAFNFRDCSGTRTSVTNANNDEHQSLRFDWTAPFTYTGPIRFQYVFRKFN